MITIARRLVFVGTVVVSVCSMANVAVAGDPGTDLLSQSRDAAASTQFSGDVEVVWNDSTGRHREQVHVTGTPGALQVGKQSIVSAGERTLSRQGGDWTLVWDARSPSSAPAPDRKYELSVKRGPKIAGRPTSMVRATLDGGDAVEERLYFDVHTSLLLRRELLDAKERVVRSISFTKISGVVTATTESKPHVPKLAANASHDAPRAVTKIDEAFRAPSSLGKGYRLVGRYRHPNGTVQLLYSDGLFSMSVFEQLGALDWSALPEGGLSRRVAGRVVRVYQSAGSTAVVWPRRGLVFTCVTDAPLADITPVVEALQPPHHRGFWSSFADVALGPFSWG